MLTHLTRDQVVAYRLRAHHLAERSPGGGVAEVAAACGIQNSPPGSALLALHARVQGMSPERMTALVAEEKSLVQTWSMRGAPYLFPAADAAVFTTGVLPPTEEARRRLMLGVGPSLDDLGLGLDDAVELTRAELGDVLGGRGLAIGPLGAEVATRIARRLSGTRQARWNAEGPYAAGQPLGEAVVHFCLRLLTLEGVVCFADRAGNTAPLVLTREWLGGPFPALDPERARAELLRRYLRCYGPTTRAAFAAWIGVRAGDTGPWWDLIRDELAQVEYDGTAWMLAEDLPDLKAASMPGGVRLLPPRDPYTQLQDRETILQRASHRQVWKTVGEPGTVLADGEIVGIWRPRKKGRRLTLTLTTFAPLLERHRRALTHAAEELGPLRGASAVEVSFEAG